MINTKVAVADRSTDLLLMEAHHTILGWKAHHTSMEAHHKSVSSREFDSWFHT